MIWGDDIGVHNISAYNHGIMGYKTPSIDRIAQEGAMFTDFYAQQSCTAGRASFVLGQHPFRTGLLTIGMPGSPHGIPDWAPTIADLLKDQGYVSGQFGKNHLGDQDQHLPTNQGFEEFFGNLYHLNAEEEPETYYYPKDPEFHEKFGPRGVIHSYADGRIEDTGPLTRKRMETADEEFLGAGKDFMDRAVNVFPESGEVRYYHGLLLLKNGRVGEAVEEFLAAVQLDPRLLAPRRRLATIDRESGDLAAAVLQRDAILAIEPEDQFALELKRDR